MADWGITGVLNAVLVQAFWLSFICIGVSALLLVRRFYAGRLWLKQVMAFLRSCHWLVTIFIAFCVGITLFVFPGAAAYIFEWPIVVIEALYGVLLAGSIVVVTLHRKLLADYLVRRIRTLSKQQIILGLVVALIVGAEYVISMATGARLDNDTPLHLAKIQLFLNIHRYTFADPYLGYNGVIDLRYSTNVLSTLLTAGAALLHLPAYKVWSYSFAFVRLVMATSIFALAKTYINSSKLPKVWFYAFLILVPLYDGTYFFDYPELPHSIVLAWFSLFFIGLKLFIEQRSYVLITVAVLLITATHSISALTVAVFLWLLGVILLCTRRLNRRQTVWLAILSLLLALPAFANWLVPVRAAGHDLAQTAMVSLHASGLAVTKIGQLVVPHFSLMPKNTYSPQILDIRALVTLVVAGAYVWLASRLKSSRVKLLLLWFVTALVVEDFSSIYMSIAGYIYLIYITKQKETKLFLAVVVCFYALIAYNPIVLTLLSGHIPLLFIARFQDLNTFAFIAPLLGVFALFRYAVLRMGLTKQTSGYILLLLLVVLSFFANIRVPIKTRMLLSANSSTKQQNDKDYTQLEQLHTIDPYIRGRVVYTDDDQAQLDMSIVTTRPIGLVYNDQSSQMENLPLRTSCDDRLRAHLSLADLTAAHVTRVVLNSAGSDGSDYQKLLAKAMTLPYLHYIGQNGYEKVFSVWVPAGITPGLSTVCTIPYRQ